VRIEECVPIFITWIRPGGRRGLRRQSRPALAKTSLYAKIH